MSTPSILEEIEAEVARATIGEASAYLHGASRDGTINKLHKTLRISQSDIRWLHVLNRVLGRIRRRGWIYREGTRSVWVVETRWRPEPRESTCNDAESAAFVRGYFDAEGGLPASVGDRFYLQFVQKNHGDLARTRDLLERLGVHCGRIHNPSARKDPDYWRFCVLAASHGLLYGSGLRLLECLRLRVKEIDLQRNEITVRDGKGGKDRVTMLPVAVKATLQAHLQRVCEQHAKDLARGLGRAPLLEDGYDIRTVQELLGHKDVKTTMVYTHVLNRGGKRVRSPMNSLQP